MEPVKLLDVSSPKTMKDTINNVLNEIDRIDGKSESKVITSWKARTPISKNDPFNYSTTVTFSTPLSDGSAISLINTDIIQLAMYGFVIQKVEGQTVTIYAVNLPTQSVVLTLHVEG